MKSTRTLREFDKIHKPHQVDGSTDLRRQRNLILKQEEEFLEAERILDFLRPYRINLVDSNNESVHQGWNYTDDGENAFRAWKKTRKNIPLIVRPEEFVTANQWFTQCYPASCRFGPIFLENIITSKKKGAHIILSALNEDALAAVLGGEESLTVRVVYFEPEDQFYFYDYSVDAYRPTSEAKLKLLLSNMLIRCAEACLSTIDREPLFTTFRTPKVLTRIIQVAKVVLAADADFFARSSSKRFTDHGYMEPQEKPSYQLFSESAVLTESRDPLPLSAACDQYARFCHSAGRPPNIEAFKRALQDHVWKNLQLKPRHDVPDEHGKFQRGFFGLKFPDADAILKN